MRLRPEQLDAVSGVVLMLQRCHPGHDAELIEAWTRAEFVAAEAALGSTGCAGAPFIPLRVIHTVEERLRTFPRLRDLEPVVVTAAAAPEPEAGDQVEDDAPPLEPPEGGWT